MENTIIKLEKINKSYQKGKTALHILKDIDLQVEQGEFVAILGPSGSGKSTLMNIIGCMDVFDTGKYYLNGIDISKQKDKELTGIRNKEIGFIFQKYHLISTYTVLQNIVMPLLMRGMSFAEATEQCMDTIKMLGLEERLEHKPAELSGGQQQRVALARALVNNPKLIIADEPTGNIDPELSYEIVDLLNEINKVGTTVVMVTHEHDLVAQFNHRVITIDDGSVVRDDADWGQR